MDRCPAGGRGRARPPPAPAKRMGPSRPAPLPVPGPIRHRGPPGRTAGRRRRRAIEAGARARTPFRTCARSRTADGGSRRADRGGRRVPPGRSPSRSAGWERGRALRGAGAPGRVVLILRPHPRARALPQVPRRPSGRGIPATGRRGPGTTDRTSLRDHRRRWRGVHASTRGRVHACTRRLIRTRIRHAGSGPSHGHHALRVDHGAVGSPGAAATGRRLPRPRRKPHLGLRPRALPTPDPGGPRGRGDARPPPGTARTTRPVRAEAGSALRTPAIRRVGPRPRRCGPHTRGSASSARRRSLSSSSWSRSAPAK